MSAVRRHLLSALAGFSLLTLAACGDDPIGVGQLAAPEGVTAAVTGPSTIVVSWQPVSGASSYEVERAVGTSSAFAAAGTASSTSFTDAGLNTETQYRYRVLAVSGTQRSVPSAAAAVQTSARGQVTISSDITSSRTFHADTVYTLSGFIKVANGATLTIQPGTTVVGDYDIPGSSLFILRGARIMAEGTADRPIVFTSERPVGQRQPGDWGGVIIIGNGITNRGAPTYIEGTGTGPQNPLQDYGGGNDNSDNSGVLRYVRIEFAGFPTAPNEELNSLTMAAVGSGTTIEYVQVLQGLDDSFEWFGGAVNGRYLVSYESADDHFDASEGYVGRNQHLIAFQSIRPEVRAGLAGGVASDPQGIENDGCWAENCLAGNNNRSASQPYTVPVFANFTLIGARAGAWESTGGNFGMMLRRGTGGLYVNGVVARYSKAAISLRGQESWNQVDRGNLAIRNVAVVETDGVFQAVDTDNPNLENRQFALDLTANAIQQLTGQTAASLFTALPTTSASTAASAFDWTPSANSPLRTGGLSDFTGLPTALRNATVSNGSPNSGITPTSYRGAADPNGAKWWQGWTSYARN
jgi:hypothetical protein